jgi:phosphoinositide-3-kinase regulatory subunit 4
MRHWRQHPAAFLRLKERYAKEGALVFTGIDYIVITIKLMQKDYMHLANCVVPIGSQIGMSVEEIAAMLKLKTRQFTTADVEKKFRKK